MAKPHKSDSTNYLQLNEALQDFQDWLEEEAYRLRSFDADI